MKKNLVLTGMMGVGKSTIGKSLAKKLKFNFADIDKIIEAKEKNTIKEIFKNKGENYFRKIEKNVTFEILKNNNLVIALGGGAFVNKLIRSQVKSTSISFWLNLNTKLLLKRLKNAKKRPLLNEVNLEVSINKIYSERKKFYNQSNFKIKCDLLDIKQIVDKIIELYENSRA